MRILISRTFGRDRSMLNRELRCVCKQHLPQIESTAKRMSRSPNIDVDEMIKSFARWNRFSHWNHHAVFFVHIFFCVFLLWNNWIYVGSDVKRHECSQARKKKRTNSRREIGSIPCRPSADFSLVLFPAFIYRSIKTWSKTKRVKFRQLHCRDRIKRNGRLACDSNR